MQVRSRHPETKNFNEIVAENLLGFPVVNILCYLHESGLYTKLRNGGVAIDPKAAFQYGSPKMQEGNLGFMYALRHLDKSADGKKYVLPKKTIIIESNILAALKLREIFRSFENGWEPMLGLMVEDFPEEVRVGLALPLMSMLQNKLSRFDHKGMTEIQALLTQLGLVQDNGLSAVGQRLYDHHVIGSFRALTSSYRRLINRLFMATKNTKALKYGEDLARDEDENARASNMLIENIVEALRGYMDEVGIRRVLDLGSGGGHFTSKLGLETILFDRSPTANKHAIETAKNKKKIKGVITGSILVKEKLQEAKEKNPDAVTINYIIHDILGQAPNYEAGLKLVKEFLLTYKEVFGKTPLLITESWNVSWDDLRQGNKPHISLYTWIHAISPQRLISPEVLRKLLQETGFTIEREIDHGSMMIKGKKTAINQTWVVRAHR